MNTVLTIEAMLSAVNLGLCLLTISLLLVRKDPQRIYMPLIVLFLAFSIISISTILELFPFTPSTLFIKYTSQVLAYVNLLILFPMLWLYVRNITSPYAISWQRKDLLHLATFGLAIAVGIFLLSLPMHMLEQIVDNGSGPTTPLLIAGAISLFALMVIWVCQSAAYLFFIVRQLTRHRAQLKQYFSSTENQELLWIYSVVLLLVSALLCSITGLFSNIIDDILYIVDAFDLVLIFILSHWGLRQGSFIEKAMENMEVNASFAFDGTEEVIKASAKYEKSALSEEHIDRIEKKILIAIEQDKLYLNPDLSLGHLAKAVAEQPNYVSQTLNGRIGETFFDFVNAWRIKDAIPFIMQNEKTILDITYAVGFNSRSSFYKAFKRETGLTPTTYKKQQDNYHNE